MKVTSLRGRSTAVLPEALKLLLRQSFGRSVRSVKISAADSESRPDPLASLSPKERLQEIQLRHAQKLEAVGQLAAGVAHEINTPIQFLSDSAYFLRSAFDDLIEYVEGRKSAEEADLEYLRTQIPKALDRTIKGLDRVANIVRALKGFSHADRGDREYADLNRMIADTLLVSKNEYKYVADVVTQLSDAPRVYCYPGDVCQVLLNLVVNAAHAIEESAQGERRGTIGIETEVRGQTVLIKISDDGDGVPEEIRDRIFEPFFTTKQVGRGTGQGLAISRSIVVEGHGGRLDFETQTGVGTTFIVELPIRGGFAL